MMELYYGSNVRIEKPDFNFCKPFKDFGKGFYPFQYFNGSECALDKLTRL